MSSAFDRTTVHVRRAVGGDPRSLEWVVERFTPFVESQVALRLGGQGRREDIEDVAGEVWLVVLRRLGDLNPRDGRYAPVLVRYLGTTALQASNNFLRRLARSAGPGHPLASEQSRDMDAIAVETKGLVSRLAQQELAEKIRICLGRMPDKRREVLVLRFMEHMSNVAIAELLGIPPNTVAVRYRRAIEQLRSILPGEAFQEIWSVRAARS